MREDLSGGQKIETLEQDLSIPQDPPVQIAVFRVFQGRGKAKFQDPACRTVLVVFEEQREGVCAVCSELGKSGARRGWRERQGRDCLGLLDCSAKCGFKVQWQVLWSVDCDSEMIRSLVARKGHSGCFTEDAESKIECTEAIYELMAVIQIKDSGSLNQDYSTWEGKRKQIWAYFGGREGIAGCLDLSSS